MEQESLNMRDEGRIWIVAGIEGIKHRGSTDQRACRKSPHMVLFVDSVDLIELALTQYRSVTGGPRRSQP